MPTPIRTPRVNNNDDAVKLSHLYVERGARIRSGDPLAEVETEKATFTVESERDGYVLAVNGDLGEMLDVGSILVWLGDSPDETVENGAAAPAPPSNGAARGPSLKSLLLKKQHGIELAGKSEPLTPEQRGMLRTVSWQREHAVPGFIEIDYDPAAWQQYAAQVKAAQGLWFDPLLSLMAWRLARIAREHPRINATIAGASAHLYDAVNLGFTIQADSTLYLVVVKAADAMDAQTFVRELGALQLAAMRHSLTPDQMSDPTVSFSSMARWNVTCHMPVLPPNTSLIVAHTAGSRLGATYDHRLLTGYDVVRVLQALAKPPKEDFSALKPPVSESAA
jgi:pyruvate/2-oxoglutarate dehydrogenase complex dihydrolipoamide acyltransferase (E2) component